MSAEFDALKVAVTTAVAKMSAATAAMKAAEQAFLNPVSTGDSAAEIEAQTAALNSAAASLDTETSALTAVIPAAPPETTAALPPTPG